MDASSENDYDDVSDEGALFEQMLEDAHQVPYKIDFDGLMLTLLCIWCKHRRFTDQQWGDPDNTPFILIGPEGDDFREFFCSADCQTMYADFHVHTDGHT